MRLLVTGSCGFVGKCIVERLVESHAGLEIVGVDNLSRPGSWVNRPALLELGVRLRHVDLRIASDLEHLGDFDWVIDAAATPSVLAGVEGGVSSRQLVEHNLLGTLNLLEWCRRCAAGMILLSSSRVYSIAAAAALPLAVQRQAFALDEAQPLPPYVTSSGFAESFPSTSPVSLYGATKLASEHMALEYSAAFGFPVWVNRCGVLAGAGQFGKADQGIFAYWLHMYQQRKALRYIGFGGKGFQVRDCLHPRDLADLIWLQMNQPAHENQPALVNVSGGRESACSLAQLTEWCQSRWGAHAIIADDHARQYDLPWVVLDPSVAQSAWNWKPQTTVEAILSEIAEHAELHPEWLELSTTQ